MRRDYRTRQFGYGSDMSGLRDKVVEFVRAHPSATQKEIAEGIFGLGAPQPRANGLVRALVADGTLIESNSRPKTYGCADGAPAKEPVEPQPKTLMGEDFVKESVKAWLEAQGFTVRVAYGREHGIDIEAFRDSERWIIEAKGSASRPEMWTNFFHNALGQIAIRMQDPSARYGLAMPDCQQYRRLWKKVPLLARERMRLSGLFVDEAGALEIG